MEATLEFRTTTRVEKYPSEEARLRGDPPEVIETTRTQVVDRKEALALGFTEKDIEEALHGTDTQSD